MMEIKEGSLVKMKRDQNFLNMMEWWPKWTHGHMIRTRCIKNSPSATTNHVGHMVCYKMDMSDYYFISEDCLEVVSEPVTQLSMFDFLEGE